MSVQSLRLSLGTAIVMGFKEGALPDPPTTAYIMVGEGCSGNCAFCTQARDSGSGAELLSRITWPEFPADDVIRSFVSGRSRGFRRICLQCLNDPAMFPGLPELVEQLHGISQLPLSASIPPRDKEYLRRLKNSGADRVGIALDAAEKGLFDRIKGYLVGNAVTWEEVWSSLWDAVQVFGQGNVSTHIIVGMGESDREVLDVLRRSREMGVLVSLFAYTPVKGTRYQGKPPELGRYRALQAARGAVMEKGMVDGFGFDENGKLTSMPDLEWAGALDPSGLFMTRGCTDCNRPYYNERPRGPIFNYPRPLTEGEQERALEAVRHYLHDRNGS
ncbi:MAG: radical SAM protein [Thermoplasmatota archaeon]